MTQRTIAAIVTTLALLALLGPPALSGADEVFIAKLSGFQEVPALSTSGRGTFTARLNDDETTLAFELTYLDLEAPVTVAHIHLGQFGVAGSVVAFLCGGGGKPACPAPPAFVTGTVDADDVIGPEAQGISVGEFAEVLRALRRGVTYANVHSETFPAGEIRGQILKIAGDHD
jgi:hypothetical protein